MNQIGVTPASFVTGFVFALLGVLFLLDAMDAWSIRLDVVLPLLLVGIGVGVLLSAIGRAGNGRGQQ